MSNFWNNIFGTIGRGKVARMTGMDFIPTNSNGDATIPQNVMFLKNSGEQNAVWLGLDTSEMQYWAYCYCSPLSAVIDREADCDINGKVRIMKNEKESTNPTAKRITNLLNKPNPIQTWEDFRGQQVVFKKIYGFCPVYAMTATGFDKTNSSYLWNLNPYYAKPELDDSFNYQSDRTPIKYWTITIHRKKYDIPAESVFLLKDGYVHRDDNYLLPLSKISGLDFAISNICAAMEADNVLLRKKGPLGFISHDPKPDNVAGYVPMTKEQKAEIQGELANYGLTWNQFQYVVSKLPVRWNPISFSVKDLMTKETTKAAIDMICDRYNYPAELMSGKNATYENRSASERYLYQNVIIPQNVKDMRVYNRFFGLDEYNLELQSDFNYLPVLQEDIVKQAQADNYKAQSYLTLYQNNVITLNQYRVYMKLEPVAGDDVYYKDTDEGKQPKPTELKPVPPKEKAA